MNYLAHAFLSRHTPELLTGGLLGDFVKGQDALRHFGPGIGAGIRLHREIDRYTDAHAGVTACRALISAPRRRFSGVLVDVFFDHFLARHWADYHEQPLEHFTARVYATLWPQRAGLPERLQRILPWMRADDWLASYADIEAVDAALHGMARRLQRYPRAAVLADGVQELLANYGVLDQHFRTFFPQLQQHSDRQRLGLQAA